MQFPSKVKISFGVLGGCCRDVPKRHVELQQPKAEAEANAGSRRSLLCCSVTGRGKPGRAVHMHI